ncbi:MAG: hypothetical protein KC583_05885, partial [Myxococcales bacterium]|nr:hypothetical protein [Myxococcales bacterium]
DAAEQRARMDRDAAETRDRLASERRKRRGNTQGCGCLLIILAGLMMATAVGGPLAIIVGFVGIVVLIVGLFA